MTTIALFRHAEPTPTVTETIMQPLSYARRGARWLMAAGLAVACLTSPANAQAKFEVVKPELRLELENPGGRIEADPGEIRPFFEKKGRQLNCDYVEYRLRFGLKGSAGVLGDPAVNALLQTVKLDFYDQMPNGLTVVDVEAKGDGTDAGGGPLPAMTIGTTADPNDTAKLENFRLSGTDLDGSGEADLRYVSFKIVAKIDHAAFPAPTIVDNQGWINLQRAAGPVMHMPSHDPNEPDDGKALTGEKTSIKIDVTDCEPPPPPPGDGEECFKVETGDVDCVPGGGAYGGGLAQAGGTGSVTRCVFIANQALAPGGGIAAGGAFFHDGGGVFGLHPLRPTFGTGGGMIVTLGDLDGDSDLDLVAGNYPRPNHLSATETVWLNDGRAVFSPHPVVPAFGGGSTLDVELGDLDGDGDRDALVVNHHNEPETVWLNDGTGAFAPHPTAPWLPATPIRTRSRTAPASA